MIDTYKPNSHKYKESQQNKPAEEKKIEKVVSGTAKTKKKTGMRKFADVFIAEDVSNVKTYILTDVIIPTAKKALTEIVKTGIDMLVYGAAGSSKSRSSGSKVSYAKFYDSQNERRIAGSENRSRFDYDEIVFETRGDAEAVLTQMDEIIERYEFVSVSDLYDMAELTAPWTGNKYGWRNLRNASVVRVRDGYTIKLPKAQPLD